MNRIEKILFYPVAVISTVLALHAWSYQPAAFAALCNIVVLLLWINPILPDRLKILDRIGLWTSIAVLMAVIVWMSMWYVR